jgi:hypothetical protein
VGLGVEEHQLRAPEGEPFDRVQQARGEASGPDQSSIPDHGVVEGHEHVPDHGNPPQAREGRHHDHVEHSGIAQEDEVGARGAKEAPDQAG